MNFKTAIRAAWRDQEIARLMGVAIKKQAREGKAPSHKVLPKPAAQAKPVRFTAHAMWEVGDWLYALNDGSVVSGDWVTVLDPRLYFDSREAAAAALAAARADGRIRPGMRTHITEC